MTSNCSTCGAAAVVQWRRLADGQGETTLPVYGCTEHALTPEAAAYVHEASCSGPGSCGCPVPATEFPFESDVTDPQGSAEERLPPGW